MLKWKEKDSRQARSVSAADNTIRIGQQEDCEVRLPNQGEYADDLFAVIKPAQSLDGWLIIPVSPFVKTLVNGGKVGLYHYLSSGDHISFTESDTEIVFEIRKGEFDGTVDFGADRLSRKWGYALTGAVALVALVAVFAIFAPSIREKRITAALDAADRSIYKINADSVFLVRTTAEGDMVVRRASVSTPGTAFLTDNGDLITARHCIEPWLNYSDLEKLTVGSPDLPVPVQFALFAETYNWLHGSDTTYYVASRCSLYDSSGELVKEILSSDFSCDRSRDDVLELGDFTNSLFWRSISAGFGRKDMMMGDIAILRGFGGPGRIHVLPESRMQILLKAGRSLYFRGFPVRHQNAGMEKSEKSLLNDYAQGRMISHGELEHGYSGSPALLVEKGTVFAAGVLSTLDDGGSGCAYSVPITEIPSTDR